MLRRCTSRLCIECRRATRSDAAAAEDLVKKARAHRRRGGATEQATQRETGAMLFKHLAWLQANRAGAVGRRTYGAAMKVLSEARLSNLVAGLLRQMREERGLVPTEDTYLEALRCLARSKSSGPVRDDFVRVWAWAVADHFEPPEARRNLRAPAEFFVAKARATRAWPGAEMAAHGVEMTERCHAQRLRLAASLEEAERTFATEVPEELRYASVWVVLEHAKKLAQFSPAEGVEQQQAGSPVSHRLARLRRHLAFSQETGGVSLSLKQEIQLGFLAFSYVDNGYEEEHWSGCVDLLAQLREHKMPIPKGVLQDVMKVVAAGYANTRRPAFVERGESIRAFMEQSGAVEVGVYYTLLSVYDDAAMQGKRGQLVDYLRSVRLPVPRPHRGDGNGGGGSSSAAQKLPTGNYITTSEGGAFMSSAQSPLDVTAGGAAFAHSRASLA